MAPCLPYRDAHKGIEANHATMCREMDKPVAGLLADLRRRGLLDETLVVGGEFGRTPAAPSGSTPTRGTSITRSPRDTARTRASDTINHKGLPHA
jgi:hypothetical protein